MGTMSDLQTNRKKLPNTIVKRSGKEVPFDKVKIRTAIYNALRATDDVEQGKDINEVTEKLLRAILRDIKAREDGKLHVEDVQDLIENRLMDFGFNNTARYFIKYRFLHKLNRDKADGTTLIDCNQTIDEYVGFSDWRIKANSNSSYSHASLINNSAGKIIANYWLDKVYSKEVGKAHRNGDLYLHDLDILGPYCCGHDLQQVLNEGFNGVRGRVNSRPPKHFREALGQMANYLGILQSEWAGAQAFSSFDTLLAPYVFRDKLSYKEVKKAIRSFIYNLNVPSRWGQCVPDTYKCLASDGKWKGPNELEQGELIITVDIVNGGLSYNQVQAIHKYPAPKVMHEYFGDRLNFLVTPGHRILYRDSDRYKDGQLLASEIILAKGDPVRVPKTYWDRSTGIFNDSISVPFSGDPDMLYKMAAMIYRDGSISLSGTLKFYNTKGEGAELFKDTAEALGVDYSFDGSSYLIRKGSKANDELVNSIITFLHNVQPYYFNEHKARLVLRVFHLLDGSPKTTNDLKSVYYAADEKMLYAIATLGVILGWSVEVDKKNLRVLMGGGPGATEKVKVREVKNENVEYVWCPTTTYGTFVCMNDAGQVFLTGNCPFTNITLDWTVPNLLKENFPTCGDMHIFSDIESDSELEKEAENRGTELHLMTYKDFVPEMKMIQRAYFEVMTEGDSTGQPFTFPIPTVNITEEFDWDDENCKYLFDNAAKIGSPYFQNFIGSQYKRNPETGELDERDPNAYNPDDLRSMCCRLQLNKAEIRESIKKRGGGLFGSDSKTGSIGNVTINLARLGYLYKGDEQGLLNRLDELMDLAKESLESKRKFILEMMERGLYPYTSRYIHSLDTFFSTIGINGANEMIRNFTNDKHNIVDDYGQAMAMRLLTHIRERMEMYKTTTGNLWNLEASPGEAACHKFAREDAKRFPDIIQAGTPKNNYYTNSTQLPVSYTNDPFAALEKQDDLQCMYTGGCVEAGNYVVTDKGRILIDELCNNKDLYKGIKVISYNKDTNTSEWDLVTEFHKIDVSSHDKIHVTGSGGLDIVTSDWHPFFVATKEGVVEKRADELVPGDYLICNRDCMLDNEKRGLDPDLAYVIGFYIGDGSMSLTHDNRGGNNIPKHLVRFHHSNKDRLQKVADILTSHGLTKAKPHYCDRRSEKLMCLSTTSKAVGEFLMRYGFTDGPKSHSVRFSEALIKELNEDNAFALLSGLLDTDSYLDPRLDDIEFFTASEQLCLDVSWLASALGLNVSVAEKRDPRYDHPHFRVLFPAKQLYKVENKLMSTRRPTGVNKDKVSHNMDLKNKYNMVRVKYVTKEDVSDNVFYDLTTEKNHNYLCGKLHYVFIHNTVLHMYMGEAVSSGDACKSFVKKILTNFRLPYISITPTFSVCPTHGYISGKHEYCPYCDEEIIKEEKHNSCCDHGED